ncbi:hypothetical protein F4821DRAFT_163280 [Hypoxylon rubiginosum]|uniref:Uncharacterized protein n=1 Tax=Hypoxylon rubiginosum TaxID=110542 RepID=A0ACC0CWQ1_9PEZI|nr:hypothetical protein F4821DRAFT_163280 [Hypoxylon rubiginosum]
MKATFASLLAAFLPALAIVRAQSCDTSGISLSCGEFSLQNGVELHGRCLSADPGAEVETSLDLDECFQNVKGHITWGPGGSFFSSCRDCELQRATKTMLRCDCWTGGWINNMTVPQYIESFMDLNNATNIENLNGQLKCGTI